MSSVTIATAPNAASDAPRGEAAAPGTFRGPWLLQVVRSEQLSPAMQRIVLGGESLDLYPAECAGAHLKVLVPRAGQEKPHLPIVGEGRPRWEVAPEERPHVRTYTVRAFDPVRCEVTLDFVKHAHGGPAASWAAEAKVGSWLAISGPGEPYALPSDSAFYLFAGDLSALPAISTQLEALPPEANGIALLQAEHEDEILPVGAPEGVQVKWLVTQGSGRESLLADAVRGVALPADAAERIAVFAAGEAVEIGAIRAYVRGELGVARGRTYLMPFWKRGAAEEIYHGERHQFMDEDPE